jgi:SNF2 family DNA or RNA helicase
VEEFGALLQFVRVFPFDTSFAFKDDIADLVNYGDPEGMVRLRALISATCLRRPKAILGLPTRTNKVEEVILDGFERHLYDKYAIGAISVIEQELSMDGKLNSFAAML